jgi:hypothetical protein
MGTRLGSPGARTRTALTHNDPLLGYSQERITTTERLELTMIDHRVTRGMILQARILLARSAFWTRGTARTTDGALVNVVTFASSRQGKDGRTVTYLTRVDGACCDCPGFQARQACSHSVACKMDAERARESAARKPLDVLTAILDRHMDDRTQTTSAF